ncbi:hypothetical protein GGTG_04349 [Gaeumannomyces tritici R3-111a-1]|uniref:Gag1-like clamp domain-containing protein n=1 Tax=Gaeumannomyces tritici (strain R3-111a-1) TaxID=644352 RepID=J3NSV0_GAET3|nr:hypothetical protein GGTG_04349 [Gaeumannomyces tritici R3-111a-1]EJT79263.1 hypothetical protein GGTG_04349 [Gaeumannomyces tritici R3-111a-1]
MIFSGLYKKSRSKHQPPLVVPAAQPSQYDADLVSRDKTKQKEAVKRYLAEKVRNDWSFQWPPAVAAPPACTAVAAEAAPAPPAEAAAPATVVPPPLPSVEGEVLLASDVADPDQIPVSDQLSSAETAIPAAATTAPAANEAPPALVDAAAGSADPRADEPIDSGAEADSDSESVYSVVSEDPLRYRPRAEWTSDLSDDDGARGGPTVSPSPFRFDTPDSVGPVIQASAQARRAKRRRATRDEASWNEGLACFTARRDAWTGARTVRLKPRPPVSPRSPASPRRSLWRFRSRDGGGGHGHNDAVVLSSPTATTATSPGTATASTLPLSPTSPTSSALPHNALHLQHIAGGVDTITPPASDGDSHTSSKIPYRRFCSTGGRTITSNGDGGGGGSRTCHRGHHVPPRVHLPGRDGGADPGAAPPARQRHARVHLAGHLPVHLRQGRVALAAAVVPHQPGRHDAQLRRGLEARRRVAAPPVGRRGPACHGLCVDGRRGRGRRALHILGRVGRRRRQEQAPPRARGGGAGRRRTTQAGAQRQRGGGGGGGRRRWWWWPAALELRGAHRPRQQQRRRQRRRRGRELAVVAQGHPQEHPAGPRARPARARAWALTVCGLSGESATAAVRGLWVRYSCSSFS